MPKNQPAKNSTPHPEPTSTHHAEACEAFILDVLERLGVADRTVAPWYVRQLVKRACDPDTLFQEWTVRHRVNTDMILTMDSLTEDPWVGGDLPSTGFGGERGWILKLRSQEIGLLDADKARSTVERLRQVGINGGATLLRELANYWDNPPFCDPSVPEPPEGSMEADEQDWKVWTGRRLHYVGRACVALWMQNRVVASIAAKWLDMREATSSAPVISPGAGMAAAPKSAAKKTRKCGPTRWTPPRLKKLRTLWWEKTDWTIEQVTEELNRYCRRDKRFRKDFSVIAVETKIKGEKMHRSTTATCTG